MSPYPEQPAPWNDPPPAQTPTPPPWSDHPEASDRTSSDPPNPLTDYAGHIDHPDDGHWHRADRGLPPSSSHPLRWIFAWLLILSASAVLFILQSSGMAELAKQAEEDPRPGFTALYLARYAVGMDQLSFAKDQAQGMLLSYDEISATSPHVDATQLRGAILAGDLIDRDEAQNRLGGVESLDGFVFYPGTEVQPEFSQDLITRIYTDPNFVPNAAERDILIKQHGWFGELAAGYNLPPSDPLHQGPRASAKRMFFGVLGLFLLGSLALLAGFCLMVTLIILLATGTQRLQFTAGPSGHSVVYLELVALFLVLFIVLQLIFGLLSGITGIDWTLAFLLISPIALLWPCIMGVSWRQFRQDMGYHRGQGVFREIAYGIGGYVAGMPIIAIGFAITFALSFFFGGSADHPMQQGIAEGELFDILLLLCAAIIWAPLVEESVFRSAFYRHMRQRPGVWTWMLATVMSSFIFAVIHPQGWLGVPVLMSIAYVLAGLREWRGSIIPSMTAHALHNTAVTAMLLIILYA